MDSLEDVLDEWKGTSCFVIVIEIIKTFSITRFPFAVAIPDNPPNHLHPLTSISLYNRLSQTCQNNAQNGPYLSLVFLLQNNILKI